MTSYDPCGLRELTDCQSQKHPLDCFTHSARSWPDKVKVSAKLCADNEDLREHVLRRASKRANVGERKEPGGYVRGSWHRYDRSKVVGAPGLTTRNKKLLVNVNNGPKAEVSTWLNHMMTVC